MYSGLGKPGRIHAPRAWSITWPVVFNSRALPPYYSIYPSRIYWHAHIKFSILNNSALDLNKVFCFLGWELYWRHRYNWPTSLVIMISKCHIYETFLLPVKTLNNLNLFAFLMIEIISPKVSDKNELRWSMGQYPLKWNMNKPFLGIPN